MGKGAIVVGVVASAAMVSNAAEFSNQPSHHELPSATPNAIVSTVPDAKPPVAETKPTGKPTVTEAEHPKASEPGKPDLSGVTKECITKYLALRAAGDNASNGDRESATAVCKAAVEQSGLSTADFAAKYGLDKLLQHSTATPKPEPKTEPKDAGLEAAMKQCLADWRAYAETTSAACARALAASGLSTEDFWKKFEAWALQQADPATTADLTRLVKECFTKYAAKDPAAGDICRKAIELSGLSKDAFFAKYGTPTTGETKPSSAPTVKPVPTATPKPVLNPADVAYLIAKCLDLYKGLATTTDTKAVSDACKAAIQASGLSSADFWAKYHPTTN